VNIYFYQRQWRGNNQRDSRERKTTMTGGGNQYIFTGDFKKKGN
jgi:hypothetical protein